MKQLSKVSTCFFNFHNLVEYLQQKGFVGGGGNGERHNMQFEIGEELLGLARRWEPGQVPEVRPGPEPGL